MIRKKYVVKSVWQFLVRHFNQTLPDNNCFRKIEISSDKGEDSQVPENFFYY